MKFGCGGNYVTGIVTSLRFSFGFVSMLNIPLMFPTTWLFLLVIIYDPLYKLILYLPADYPPTVYYFIGINGILISLLYEINAELLLDY